MTDDTKLGRCNYDQAGEWPFPAKRDGAAYKPSSWPAAPVAQAPTAAPWPPGEDWLQQIVYALERQERALRAQADALHDLGDYSAELPDEDADRMREAVALLGIVRAGWEQAAGVRPILRDDVQFLISSVNPKLKASNP